MSGICGIVGANQIRPYNIDNLKDMMNALIHRGKDENGTFTSQRALLGYMGLKLSNYDSNIQPLNKYDCVKRYTIVFDGNLKNSEQLKKQLIELGYKFQSNSDCEIVLNCYIQYKEKCLDFIKGNFAFAIYDGYQIFLVRDKLGIKPLYYTIINDKLLFASEIKGLFAINDVKRKITKDGFKELYSLGPTSTPGITPYDNIYSVEPGQFIYYSLRGLRKQTYYKLPLKENNYTFEQAKNTVHDLVTDLVKFNLKCDVDVSCLLSGGLDSSIICSIASKEKKLNTYSLDYKDNDKNFVQNNFQRSRDNDYARLMSASISSNHHEYIIDSEVLYNNLNNSLIARDMPGMADIDSSIYTFAKYLSKDNKVILSGECADEIFGGYPWFYRKDLNQGLFPWHRSIKKRISLLNEKYQNLGYEKYIEDAYNTSIKNIEYLDNENEEDKNWRKLTYLNIYWFMQTLVHRNDSQTMAHGLEARVPFADIDLIELIYNLPKEYKYQNDKEKYLLREAFIDDLPYDIVYRKKNPFPKTFDPKYFELVSSALKEKLNDKNNILNIIFNKDELLAIINNPENLIPWFGQLMTTPQLIAYLLQFEMWVNDYNLELDFLTKKDNS